MMITVHNNNYEHNLYKNGQQMHQHKYIISFDSEMFTYYEFILTFFNY